MISLNLLPPEEKANLRLGNIRRIFLNYALALISALIFGVLILAFIYFLLAVESKNSEGNYFLIQQSSQGQSLKSQQDQIKKFNSELLQIEILQKKQPYYSLVILEIANLMPPGVRIEKLEINEKNEIIVSGFAQNREKVVLFKEGLERSKNFKNITSPLSNLVKQIDIYFYFKFELASNE